MIERSWFDSWRQQLNVYLILQEHNDILAAVGRPPPSNIVFEMDGQFYGCLHKYFREDNSFHIEGDIWTKMIPYKELWFWILGDSSGKGSCPIRQLYILLINLYSQAEQAAHNLNLQGMHTSWPCIDWQYECASQQRSCAWRYPNLIECVGTDSVLLIVNLEPTL